MRFLIKTATVSRQTKCASVFDILITVLILILSVSGFAQNKSAFSSEAKMLLDTYYPGNDVLHSKVAAFYDSLANCGDTATVNWLFNQQEELSILLSDSFDVDYKNDSNVLFAALKVADKQLNATLVGFNFYDAIHPAFEQGYDQSEIKFVVDNPLEVYSDMQIIFDLALSCSVESKVDDIGLAIIFEAWGPVKHDDTNYRYDICCDCAKESALGSGLHSKLLNSIADYTSYSNLFADPLDEIKRDIKHDVLHTHAFSSPKKDIIAEFELIKPLLDLNEEEALIYEKKRAYLEETTESGLHNYGR